MTNTPHHNKRSLLKTVYKTVFCLGLIFTLYKFPPTHHLHEWILKANPMGNKVEKTELFDLVLAHLADPVAPETNIVILHCANDTRQQIANKVKRVQRDSPAVVALDIIFSAPYKPEDDALVNVLKFFKHNIVLAKKTHTAEEYTTQATVYYHPKADSTFMSKLDTADMNFGAIINNNIYETKRYYYPKIHGKDTSFAAKIYKMYEPYDRSKSKCVNIYTDTLLINYRLAAGRVSRYLVVDDSNIDNINFHNKIVLFGGWDSTSLIDKHYTPLNGTLGRSLPDMNGSEYHAQVLSMLIDGEYIKELCRVLYIISLFIIGLFYVWLSERIHHHSGLMYLYHLLLEVIVFLLSVPLFIWLSACLFNASHIKAEPSHYIIPIFYIGVFLDLYRLLIEKIAMKYFKIK